MAYLRDLVKPCEAPYCLKKATVELMWAEPAYHPHGVFCAQHGAIALKDREILETELWRKARG